MANVDRPNGAVPVRRLDGSACIPANIYSVDVTNATALFVGDFLTLEDDGNVGVATVQTGNLIVGVMMGVADDYGDLSRRHLPATTAGNVYVQDDPFTIFEIQDDAGATLSQADVGGNAPFIAGAGNSTSGISGHELSAAGVVTTIEQLRILRLVPRPDNAWGVNARLEVLINEHQFNNVDSAGV